ncbi:MAG: helicase [Deltaproteobacteria bacterium RIFOXYB12_FULL_58_9]|nr:MAG: helicase [Deltaproteobacteria bacterium RIFOXYB12_FULL_58_9]
MTTTSAEVRASLVEALELDLVGPGHDSLLATEVLPQAPSRWYLTGFLVPHEAALEQKADPDSDEELGEGDSDADEDAAPEKTSARKAYFPSSMGMSVLVPQKAKTLAVVVTWGDYALLPKEQAREVEGPAEGWQQWRRTARRAELTVDVGKTSGRRAGVAVPDSFGLKLVTLVRKVSDTNGELVPAGTKAVSVFIVNNRDPAPDAERDQAFAFQVQLRVVCNEGLVPRPNLRGQFTDDTDERIADLQYRHAFELAVGHNCATHADREDGVCRSAHTTWVPLFEVERVETKGISGVELTMDALAKCKKAAEVRGKLEAITKAYAGWLAEQKKVTFDNAGRTEVAESLMQSAERAKKRIAEGLDALNDAKVFQAFIIANEVMAEAIRRRLHIQTPKWRLFQIAFLLMNLKGIADPEHTDRDVVDLIFFPTGGGKTEAYLGLAAFTLVHRRLCDPSVGSAGLAVLMRYTLRLLTLDQLSRAAGLVCALELKRQQDVELLGTWPFEIGLWVGQAATPNRMGHKGDNDEHSARSKTLRYMKDSKANPSPVPLENCPWCGERFKATSFVLTPSQDHPTDLRVVCANRDCEFKGDRPLPILAVDEPIYRRLPCFLIATVDKFAQLPWVGECSALFGKVSHYDKHGFYGPCAPGKGHPLPQASLPPPDLIIQDELHLISGPLGTMAGLYETAIEALCTRPGQKKPRRPKVVASTATVRQAQKQIQALFGRERTEVFPPLGPDLRDAFFARTVPLSEKRGRLYVGIAAQGKSAKVMLLRAYLALMSAAQRCLSENGGDRVANNPADPYMTLLGYFNSLRELGGSRRIVEDEVRTRLNGYGERRRVGEKRGIFERRRISPDVYELTSRETTARVADTKRRLALAVNEDHHVDVALATNMISVGLDITRLGLMVVSGQPKATAEYIQATSRVGRDEARPGLVVTLLNVHKARDRSHYERFEFYHQSFYRAVEATSVTPFSPRAIDRGLCGMLVGLARGEHPKLTPALGAAEASPVRSQLEALKDIVAQRAASHDKSLDPQETEALRQQMSGRVVDLLDAWAKIAEKQRSVGAGLQYQREVGGAPPLLHDPLDPSLAELPSDERKFTAGRSMRDVEASVNLWVRNLDGSQDPADIEGDGT